MAVIRKQEQCAVAVIRKQEQRAGAVIMSCSCNLLLHLIQLYPRKFLLRCGRPAALPRVARGRKIGVTCPRTLASLKGTETEGGESDSP